MPEIQEYLPQVEGAAPVGATSPNIELAGAVGKSVEKFGQQVEGAGDLIERRMSQQETADTYAKTSDIQAGLEEDVQAGVQAGSLDVDKLKDKIDESFADAGDNLVTAQGKNYLNRRQARIKSTILGKAMRGKAIIASNNAKQNFANAIGTNSSILMNDPSSFEDVREEGIHYIDKQIKSGGLPAAFREKAINEMGAEYAKSAIRGWANLDPADAKERLDSGDYDDYLKGDQKHQMYGEIKTTQRDMDAEDARADRAEEKAQQAGEKKWGQDHFDALTNGSLSVNTIRDGVRSGVLSSRMGEHYISAIETDAKREAKTDIRTYNDLVQRITNPQSQNPISSPDDLLPYVASGKLSADGSHSLKSLRALFNVTPEGKALQQGEKGLFDSARRTIRFKNLMTGQNDLLGEQKLAQFMSDYATAKGNVKDQGGTMADLVNPNSPLYFGKKLNSYQTSIQDQVSHVAQDRNDKALGMRPSQDHPDGKPVPEVKAKLPTESWGQYLKRIGK